MKTMLLKISILVGLLAAAGNIHARRLPAPILSGLGDLHHPVTTGSPEAQRFFDQGLRLVYGFNHKESIRSFRAAAQLDPDCAMAWWGVAYAYGPHVNKPMTEEENARAWEALTEAKRRAPSATARERGYIRALSARYTAAYSADRSALDRAYAAAMRELAREYPDDLDARTLLAEALMDTMPWDYWAGDRSPKPETEEAMAALKFVLKRNPNHPGANHFFIHAVEAGPSPETGLPAADRLALYAPGAGHLVHMPSHIYMRVGQYADASKANERAVKADRTYIRECAAQGFYPGVYYPHNLHFLWWAKLFEGRSADAWKAANKVSQFARDNVCGPSPVVEAPRFRHLPWLTLARFGKWEEVLRVPQPPDTNTFLIDRAMWHFVRGLAFAALKDAGAVEREHDAMSRLARSEDARKLDSPTFPASAMLGVAERWLAGKVAGAKGDGRAMVECLREAVKAEDALPYMEPSYWSLPVRPTLGAACLAAGDAAAAEMVFREDLERVPRNPWGLLGLEASLRSQGKTQAADGVRREFKRAWERADVELDLAWF